MRKILYFIVALMILAAALATAHVMKDIWQKAIAPIERGLDAR